MKEGTALKQRPREVLGTMTVYDGQHRAERVREASPTGGVVEHLRVVTQTYIDRLHADLKLTDDERDAGQTLRDDHYAAGLFVASMAVADPEKPIVGGGGANIDLVRGEEAFRDYRDALRAVTVYGGRDTLIRACIDERDVSLDRLKAAMGDLVRHYRRTKRGIA